MELFKRLKNETEEEFGGRLNDAFEAKTHPEVATLEDCRVIYNRECGYEWTSAVPIRTLMGRFRAETRKTDLDIGHYKNLTNVRDEYNELRNAARIEARADALMDRLVEAVKNQEKIKYTRKPHKVSRKESGIGVVSDVHYGAEHENFISKYNVQIAEERLMHYADYLIQYANTNQPEELVILNTGDLVEGMIHIGTRIAASHNIIDQTINMSELMVKFLSYILENTTVPIRYGSVLDNHSRVHPDKKNHLESENFARIMEWYIMSRFEEGQIDFMRNDIDPNIGYVEVQGLKVAYVHGHLDKPQGLKDKLSRLIGTLVDAVIISHRHHVATLDGVYQSGSMKGVDEHAINFRATDEPSQMLLVVERGDFRVIQRRDIYFDVEHSQRYAKLSAKQPVQIAPPRKKPKKRK